MPDTPYNLSVATVLTAMAVSAQLLDGTNKPLKITVIPSQRWQGNVQYTESVDVMPTASGLRQRLVSYLCGYVLERESQGVDTGGTAKVLNQASSLAGKIVELQALPGDPIANTTALVAECLTEAQQFVSAHRQQIHAVAAVLAEKGELTGAELEALLAR